MKCGSPVWLLASLVSLGLTNSRLPGQMPDRHPFEGLWTLTYSAATKPGGETLSTAIGSIISPQNLAFTATHTDFTVSEDGKFGWLERKNGYWHSDARHIVGGLSSHPTQTDEPLLVASGQLDRERKMKLTLRWSHGSGGFTAGDGRPGALFVSDDGSQVTVFFLGRSTTHATQYLTTEWTLAPISIEREEVSEYEIKEIARYSARRQRTLSEFGAGPLPVNESIRVEQIRQMKLVPRG
jgi:hypothetical protein